MRFLKKLRIAEKALITSECWTYYKFLVLQNSPEFEEWILSHMQLYINENCYSVFGEKGDMYSLEYYSNILKFDEIKLVSCKKSDIVETLIDLLDSEKYVILDVNYNRIIKPNEDDFWLHETLIYGYDEKSKVFYSPIMRNGRFVLEEISFEIVEVAYGDVVDFYKQDKMRLFNRRRWFFGITAMSLCSCYHNDNKFYDFIDKLTKEIRGSIFLKQEWYSDQTTKTNGVFYEGLSILLLLSQKCKQAIEDDEILKNLWRNSVVFLKLYEHQYLIQRGMKCFFKSVCKYSIEMKNLIEQYSKSCSEVKNIIYMFQKLQLTADKGILDRIAIKLKKLYMVEKEILDKFVSIARTEYIEMVN